jgi:hypothetical protein
MTDEPDDDDEVEGYYGIEVRTKAGLASDEPHHFIDEYEGLVCFDDDFTDAVTAGEFHATLVRTDDAQQAGISVFDLWDHSHALHLLYSSLFNSKTDEFKVSIERRFEAHSRDVLVLDSITILPSHRGKNLGLAVASRLIDLLGRGCDLAVCLPSPLQFGGMPEVDPDKAKALALDAFKADRDLAFARLRRYWGQLGFKRLGKEDDNYALSLKRIRPRIQSLAKFL